MGVVSTDTVVFVVIMSIIAVIVGAVAVWSVAEDSEKWVKTENPHCYLHIVSNDHLFAPDTTTRTRYCEVAT